MEENISQKEKEKAEEEMIEQAFQELLNDYLAVSWLHTACFTCWDTII